MLLGLLPLMLFYTYALNLDKHNPQIFYGPKGSYFGFSFDFYQTADKRMNIIVGAPRLNSSEANVSNTGGVFLCPWGAVVTNCSIIPFDQTGDQRETKDGIMSIDKSDQWFGATVRVWNTSIVVCAPFQRYNFVNRNDISDESGKTPTGACYFTGDLKNFHEFAPCRDTKTERYHFFEDSNNRFCELGFSTDISKKGVLLAGAPGGYYFEGLYAGIPLSHIPQASNFIIQKYPNLQMSREIFVNDSYRGFAVAYGEFTEDNVPEVIVSSPNFENKGLVEIYSGYFRLFRIQGNQIAAFFGHSVAVTDINGDNLDDLLVGAPLFIERKAGGKLLEVGQVYVYKQNSPTILEKDPQILSGTYVYGQFGASIAPLGDLDQDGYNDVAVGSPFGGQSGVGCVYIYKGEKSGLSAQPSQILESPPETPSMFGFALRGGEDIDQNGYPDLIVGAFDADAVYVYRAHPVLILHTSMIFSPDSLNPDLKLCKLPNGGDVTCFTMSVCIQALGKSLPEILTFTMDMQLDSQKSRFLRRSLFFHLSQSNDTITMAVQSNSQLTCTNTTAYLKEDSEFKDKLSPIAVSVNVSLETEQSSSVLPPVIQGNTFLQQQIHILLGCGENNICVPHLQLSASWGKEPLIIGIDNFVQIDFNATNLGERAYEAELHAWLPSGAHYMHVLGESKERILCSPRKENDNEHVVCELGNPMKNGTQIRAGLQLSISDLEDSEGYFSFPMQIKSRNSHNSSSPIVLVHFNVTVEVSAELRGSAQPAEVVLPLPKWKPREESSKPEDKGKIVTHVYELYNIGPGTLNVKLIVQSPENYEGDIFLYPLRLKTDDIVECTDVPSVNYLQLDITEATKPPVSFSKSDGRRLNKREEPNKDQDVGNAGSDNSISSGDGARYNQSITLADSSDFTNENNLLQNCTNAYCWEMECSIQDIAKGQRATVKLESILWVSSFMKRPQKSFILRSRGYFLVTGSSYRIQPVTLLAAETHAETVVQWVTPDGQKDIPVRWIILGVFGGLLILALFVYAMWKLGFFRRTRPPTDEGEELTADK
ncbi:PREDICTED: integrin alpha-IIb-like [Nanorana parkeri]|uniref:integrin alpha-IIb-like n=1 Tax=Nanorana parkeri TaxID=125878 RepID=UPI0008548F89|nr:PREDICTED: integrin alpha-IIb-like [Nanorana parkeri]